MKTVLLMGGKGSRLHPLTEKIPKGLLPIGNKTLIERIIDTCEEAGLIDFVIVCRAEQKPLFKKITDTLKHSFAYATHPEETIGLPGAIHCAKDHIQDGEKFIVLGDVLIENSLKPIVDVFKKSKNEHGIITFPMENTAGYGLLEIDDERFITKYSPKDKTRNLPGEIESGMYLFDNSIFDYTGEMVAAWDESEEKPELKIWDLVSRILSQNDLNIETNGTTENNTTAEKNSAKKTNSKIRAYTLEGWWVDVGGSLEIYHETVKRYS